MDVPPFISLTKEEDIEEIAKKWASAISNKYAREDAEEAARIVLRSGIVTELPDLREADLGGRKRFSGLTRANFHAAICEGDTSSIRVNKRAYKTWVKDTDDAVRGGWHAQRNTILHELGHYIDFCNDPDFFRSVEHEWSLDNADRKFVKKQLSEYSLTNRAEFEAELNSAILSGKAFPEEILALSHMKQTKTPIAKQLLDYGSGKKVCLPNEDLTKKYKNALKAMFRQEGSTFTVDILGNKDVQEFISTHATMLNNSFVQVKMSDKMRERLTRSNYIFSGIKTFHELNEAFPSMLDENGNKKPFERFLNDVRKINDTYNANYLHAEYNFVQASATMAAKWEQFSEDGDRYYLQYRTAKDDKVRPEHAALDGVTLPMSDSFWETYYPPNGWNCRCTVVQVRKQKYPATEHAEAMSRGEEAMNGERYNIFRFNSGKQGKTMPDYNPYTIKRCNDCDVAKGGSVKLGAFIPDYQLCRGCVKIRECYENREKANSKQNLAKRTKEEKHKIYSKPTEEQFEILSKNKEGYEVSRHILKDKKEMDYNRVLDAAKLLSKFDNVRILPEIHASELDIRNRLGLPEKKNPDLMFGNTFADVKSPFSSRNIVTNANDACKQNAIACITDHLCHIDKNKIGLLARKVLSDKNYTRDTVFFVVENKLYKYTTADL
jgi:SPP1 gp7 family putative phage head morphogenesis protein